MLNRKSFIQHFLLTLSVTILMSLLFSSTAFSQEKHCSEDPVPAANPALTVGCDGKGVVAPVYERCTQQSVTLLKILHTVWLEHHKSVWIHN